MIHQLTTEVGIRTTEVVSQEVSTRLGHLQSDIKRKRWYRRMFNKRNRGRTIRYSLLAGNAVLLMVVIAFVAQKPQTTNSSQVGSALVANQDSEEIVNPLDALSSADIAANIATAANLREVDSVRNKADTVNAQLSIAPSGDVVNAKPQVIATALKSRADLQNYTVVAGDTVTSIAAKFGVTSDTIRWSNNLTGDSVDPGKVLIISPITGIAYKVAAGDTVDSILSKYQVDRDQLVRFNDIESGTLPVGEYIVLPNGQPAARATAQPSLANVSSAGGFAWGGGAVYGSNGYDYGYCTWYVKNRKPELPSNLGNASTWKVLAQRAGFSTGNVPRAGAVIWTPPRDYYGHVGYVESVGADGSVNVSEMNVAGWGVVSRKTLSAEQAASYGYIY